MRPRSAAPCDAQPARRRGTSLLEVAISILVTAVLGTGLYLFLRQSNQGMREAMTNHQLNEESQRLLDRLTDELREANLLVDSDGAGEGRQPPTVARSAVDTLKSTDPNNILTFTRLQFDFSKTPSATQNNFTSIRLCYRVEKMNPANATGPYQLSREETHWDDHGQSIASEKKSEIVAKNLDDLIFYRLSAQGADLAGTGPRTIHVLLRQRRHDRDADARPVSYNLEQHVAVRIRGNWPK